MAARRTVSLAKRRPKPGQIDWNVVIKRAKEIVESYDTGVTLRQLYYRLVSAGLIPNDQNNYKHLSRKTAQARREGWFPALIDRTRAIEREPWWNTAHTAMQTMCEDFRVDRTEGQEWGIYLGVEKHGMSVQLMHWFGELGIPILALGGYSSQTFVDVVKRHVVNRDRASVLLYAGDYDPSGMDIDRDFEERTAIFDDVVRVALRREHIDEYSLPPMPGKHTDARSASFILNHGDLIQVELDALEPDDLRKLYQAEIDRYWDESAYEVALEREADQQKKLDFLFKYVNHAHPVNLAVSLVNDLEDNREILRVMDAAADRMLG